jgi:hypothetical protein
VLQAMSGPELMAYAKKPMPPATGVSSSPALGLA